MYANIKKLPGGAVPPTYRITFHVDPGTRPQEYRLTGDADELERFLTSKLELPAALARSVAREAEFERVASFDRIQFTEDEIRHLIRSTAMEARQAANEREQRGKTVQPVS